MTLFKALITLGALYYVFSQLDFGQIKSILLDANWFWLFLAFIAFNASKILSSVRLNHYFRSTGLTLTETYSLILYYIGMFYNLFLPGGISGDGYKVYLLHKHFGTGYKPLLHATLLDRISGLAALLFLGGVLFLISSFSTHIGWLVPVAVAGLVAVYPVTYLMNKKMFSAFLPVFGITSVQGMGVQLLQLLSALFIVWAIAPAASEVDYLTLFLVSSVAAVLPISIGGIGVRELVFLYGFTLLQLDVNSGVLFSLLFFLVTALSSLTGLFLLHRSEPTESDHKREAL